MINGHVFMAVSLDGFIARSDYSLDWLMKQNTEGEEHGYNDFMDGVDGIVMGSGSFKTILGFDEWPYKKPVNVMSQSLTDKDIPEDIQGKVKLTLLSPKEVMSSLGSEGWKRAYVDGGQVVQSFIREGLIESLTITHIPILIGSGIRLFGEIDQDIDLQLRHSQSFASGLVQSHYTILKS